MGAPGRVVSVVPRADDLDPVLPVDLLEPLEDPLHLAVLEPPLELGPVDIKLV